MGSHPLNLAIRFLLEMSALVAIGIWGWKQSGGWFHYVFAIGLPMILAAIWGTFAVRGDPSRSGKTPVATPGFLRLVIELGIFAFAAWSLFEIGHYKLSIALGTIVLLHYIISYDRVKWLLSN